MATRVTRQCHSHFDLACHRSPVVVVVVVVVVVAVEKLEAEDRLYRAAGCRGCRPAPRPLRICKKKKRIKLNFIGTINYLLNLFARVKN